tara:strand:+ start:43 stop:558 length:516 start_codon:yes stop_codon:yes gene_type:complete
MKEIWKDIANYEGYYQVSNLGNVKSLSREVLNCGRAKRKITKEIILKQTIVSNKYYYISLNKKGVSKTYSVHRLVANAFLKKDRNRNYVNHINEIKTDNRDKNLEWTTHTENIRHSLLKPVIQKTKEGVIVKVWDCAKDAKIIGGFNNSLISRCCKGFITTHLGYKWEYKI